MKKIILLLILSTSFVFAKDLDITLAPETAKVEAGKTVRVRVNFSRAPKKFSATDISIDGGRIESVRKLSARVYVVLLRANEDVKEVELQIQADTIRDGEGDLNESASNSAILKVVPNTQKIESDNQAKLDKLKSDNDKAISSLLEAITASNKNSQTTNTTNQAQIQPQVQYYNCNGQAIPTTQQCVQNTNFNTGNVLYVPNDVYGGYGYTNYVNSYNPYNTNQQAYVVYPTGLYSNYEISYYDNYYSNYGYYPKTYYTTYYNSYGYYPQSYYSSPFYEAGYGLGSGLRGLFGW